MNATGEPDGLNEISRCPACGQALSDPLAFAPSAAPCPACGVLPWCSVTSQDGFVILDVLPGRTPDTEGLACFVETHVRASRRQAVLCDLTALDTLDSSLVGRLVFLHRRVRSAGHRLLLCGLCAQVRQELSILKLDRVFELVDDSPPATGRLEFAVQVPVTVLESLP